MARLEWAVTIQPQDTSLSLQLGVWQPGIVSLGLGIVPRHGQVSQGILRLRVEDHNIQVLTEDGVRLNFGELAENCSTEVPLVLVNCGQAAVPVHLHIQQPHTMFSLEGGDTLLSFVIPGMEGDCTSPGQGVAKQTMVGVNTAGMEVAGGLARLCTAQLTVGLGESTDSER